MEIIAHLGKNNYDVGLFDAFLIRMIGHPQHGWIEIGDTEISTGDFFYRLTMAKAAMHTITLIPGETTEIFLKQIASQLKLDAQRLQKAYWRATKYPDGLLIADTYNIPIGTDEEALMDYLISHAQCTHREFSDQMLGHYDEAEWMRYVTIASIVQKETPTLKEMPIVASVIYNRLEKNMALQMDGTLNYGKYSHVKVTPERIRQDTSLYNTYRNKGLPPYPVCAVGKGAIYAAVHPAQTDYLYFVRSRSNTHIFSNSYNQHLANIKSVKK